MELHAPTHRLLTVATYCAPFLTPPSLWPSKRYRVVLVPQKAYYFLFLFSKKRLIFSLAKGGGDDRVEMISVREIPTLSALTMCFWQRFLKKHGVSKWRMSIYRHDIPERNAQGGLSVSWTSSTSSEVKNMELSVDQIIKDGHKFLDR